MSPEGEPPLPPWFPEPMTAATAGRSGCISFLLRNGWLILVYALWFAAGRAILLASPGGFLGILVFAFGAYVLLSTLAHWAVIWSTVLGGRLHGRRLQAVLFGPIPGRLQQIFVHGLLAALTLGVAALIALQLPLSSDPFSLWGLEGLLAEAFLVLAATCAGSAGLLELSRVTSATYRAAKGIRVPVLTPSRVPSVLSPVAQVAHWTDLHLTGSPEAEMVEGGEGGNKILSGLIAAHEARLDELDLILLTGDVTDAGQGEEWRQLFDLVPEKLRRKCVLVPGNHDLNIHDPADLRAFSIGGRSFNAAPKLKLLRFLLAIDRIQGERSQVLGDDGTLRPFRSLIDEFREPIQRFCEDPPSPLEDIREDTGERVTSLASRWRRTLGWYSTGSFEMLPVRLWKRSFPLLVSLPDCALKVVVLDSVEDSDNMVTNAFGRVPWAQLRRLRKMLPLLKGAPYIVALHHQIGMLDAMVPLRTRLMGKFSTLLNGEDLLEALRSGSSTVVFNGHQHIRAMAVDDSGKVRLVSGPSTTLGDARDPRGRPGFGSYTLLHGEGVGVHVGTEAWHTLPASGAGAQEPPL